MEENGTTAGGQKRINLLLTGENHDYIKVMARASGMNMTEYLNALIERQRAEDPGEYEAIKARQAKLKP